MCFNNDKIQLDKFRTRKTRFTVWKTGHPNRKTGIVHTSYCGYNDNDVIWKKGTTVKPHAIRKPLKHRQVASAGLYFYTEKPIPHYGAFLVTAKINPKDIIAVNEKGTTICVTEAYVVDAPNLDPKEMRIKFLIDALKNYQESLDRWKKEQETNEEALEHIERELAELPVIAEICAKKEKSK